MWLFSKPRGEHDNRFLMNLDQCSRINLTQLGEKWFIEVMLGTETIPIAQVSVQEEADKLLRQIFDSLHAGEKALDLDNVPESREEQADADHAPPQNP